MGSSSICGITQSICPTVRTRTPVKINTMPTFSVGANYEFTDHMSAYVRVNNGVFFDNFDDIRCNVTTARGG